MMITFGHCELLSQRPASHQIYSYTFVMSIKTRQEGRDRVRVRVVLLKLQTIYSNPERKKERHVYTSTTRPKVPTPRSRIISYFPARISPTFPYTSKKANRLCRWKGESTMASDMNARQIGNGIYRSFRKHAHRAFTKTHQHARDTITL
jgi:hypothetical protein